jgi:ribonuclease P protein component
MGRLRKGKEFDTVYREGAVVAGPLAVVRYRPNDLGVTRWGFAVGKRAAKLASSRNRLRRQLREICRSLPALSGLDIVVTARGRALEVSFSELTLGLQRLLERAGVVKADVGP